jgi:hypothetical protein
MEPKPKDIMMEQEDKLEPKSIFDLGYFSTKQTAQEKLDLIPLGDKPILHIPSFQDINNIRKKLHTRRAKLLRTNMEASSRFSKHPCGYCRSVLDRDARSSRRKTGVECSR